MKMNKVTASIGIALGAGAGYVLAHLLAPMPGEEFQAKLDLEGKKLKRRALLKADDLIKRLNYAIGRQVSKEEARRLNDLRRDIAQASDQTDVAIGAGYGDEPIIQLEDSDLTD